MSPLPDTVDGSPEDSQSPPTALNFTFVNQAEDLVSLCNRRINNREQRHTIRSHVMQRVRQAESAQGKKRPTGRDPSKRPSTTPSSRRKSSDSEPSSSNESRGLNTASAESDRLSLTRSPRQSPRLHLTPAASDFDPFDTLPTNSLPHQSSESLLQYCFDVLLPMTFAVEMKRTQDRLKRQGMVLHTKISNPASFLGFLATTAAHRAVLYGRHKDLAPSLEDHDDLILDQDYILVKQEATAAVRQALAKRTIVDEQILEACFGLISTASVVGNFQEAKMHLKMLDRLTSQIELSEETLRWIPIANVKAAIGLLERPVVPLLFERESIPDQLMRRIHPNPATELARLHSDFRKLDRLSQPLTLLLSAHRNVCYLCEINSIDPENALPRETSILSRKATELEFDLLAYPYEFISFPRNSRNEPQLPALEGLVRLAALGMLSISPHTIIPATGNGRAITHHQRKALDTWLRELETGHTGYLRVTFWALFVYVQNALKQPEEPFFLEILATISHDLRLSSWKEAEKVMFGFLYIPAVQSSTWRAIWADVWKRCQQRYPKDDFR